jgi:hypothetical protein
MTYGAWIVPSQFELYVHQFDQFVYDLSYISLSWLCSEPVSGIDSKYGVLELEPTAR